MSTLFHPQSGPQSDGQSDPQPDPQSDGHTAVAARTIDLIELDAAPGRRFPGDPYLARLRASSAEAARLRECLDVLPLATVIVDRSTIEDLRLSFVSRAAALLLGIDGGGGPGGTVGPMIDGARLSSMFVDGATALVAALQDLSTTHTVETEIVEPAGAAHPAAPIPVRVTMTVLEADLGDSILCTFAMRP